MRPKALVAALSVSLAITSLACGGLDAESFTDRIKDQGVQMELGRQLASGQEGIEVYDFRIRPVDSTSEEARGTLEVYGDERSATAGWTRCLAAADLTCYRAEKIVVVLPGDGLEARRLAAAMKRL